MDKINTEKLVAHVILAVCQDEDLLKKLLEIKEEDLSEDSIKEVCNKWEVVNAKKLGLKKNVKKGGIARQVQGKEAMICYRCQRKEHISKECKLPKDKLKCTHYNTVGRHLTND